jgi:hypothetical protein
LDPGSIRFRSRSGPTLAPKISVTYVIDIVAFDRLRTVLTIVHFGKKCVPHPWGSLTMCVLIKDLQRSGVNVCANKGLSGESP